MQIRTWDICGLLPQRLIWDLRELLIELEFFGCLSFYPFEICCPISILRSVILLLEILSSLSPILNEILHKKHEMHLKGFYSFNLNV